MDGCWEGRAGGVEGDKCVNIQMKMRLDEYMFCLYVGLHVCGGVGTGLVGRGEKYWVERKTLSRLHARATYLFVVSWSDLILVHRGFLR